MAIDERIIELLIDAEDLRKQGRDVTAKDLCPESPELWTALRDLLHGLGYVDRLMHISVNHGGPSRQTEALPTAPRTDVAIDVGSEIGRYRVTRLLGTGGFGRVYLAHDDELDRPVAIKVSRPERIVGIEGVQAYLAEARALARLDHPDIVPVHDVGRTDDGLCYVVSKYIPGSNLADRLNQARFSFRESAEIVAVVAEALHHAHTRDLVHRDIKPANILVDTKGKPYVADFGLALTDEDFGKGHGYAGTSAYMSPEQARGEGHRVDGRSDIFSLGVILYELLTGRKPFRGRSSQEVLEQITTTEPRPPRQIDDTIPRELERICQKALSKRTSERYSTARDMAEDLRHFLVTEASYAATAAAMSPALPAIPSSGQTDSHRQPVKIVPKGLRAFDQHDAEFFLELLPGPRDRDGLPEGLRFWKTRIESVDPVASFKVGLIYGPSGCGKSSMVKAGLLPHLARHVVSVYIEATPAETEKRLLMTLRNACPELPEALDLVDALAAVRRGRILRPGQKVLLLLDQFEQWLFARRGEPNTELIAALRQCDGRQLQAVVLVRDDFWMAATRFMKDLDIRLVEGENSAAIDLFDLIHARRVLTAFGRAYGILPDNTSDLTTEHRAFFEQSIAGLAQDDRVIPVRLALFAEMVKGKPWTATTLKQIGGTDGVGLSFLEETFSASIALPEHRLHRNAAQAVLKALLPPSGSDIKGRMRSETELREASGYTNRPTDFDDLIRILDPELRLITPTDPAGSTGDKKAPRPAGDRHYQLTHDYLVHSLREWLNREQRETWRGRAELRLVECAGIWSARPEARYLPSIWEWTSIRLFTRKKDWSHSQQRMMRQAGRVHGLRGLGLVIVIALVTWAGVEVHGSFRASALVESLKAAGTADVPPIVQQLDKYRRWADPRLRRMAHDSDQDSRDHLHSSLALLDVDPSQVGYLKRRLLIAPAADLPVIIKALRPFRSQLVPKLWSTLDSVTAGDDRLLRSAATLADFDPENPHWTEAGDKVAEALVTENSLVIRLWMEALRAVSGNLTGPLATIFRDKQRSEMIHSLATDILTDYAGNDPRLLADLLMDAESKSYVNLFRCVESLSADTVPVFRAELAKKAGDIGNEPPISRLSAQVDAASPVRHPFAREQARDELAARQAKAAVALIRLGYAAEVWPLLQHSADPRLRSFLINWLSPLGGDPERIAGEVVRSDSPATPGGTRRSAFSPGDAVPTALKMDAILFHPQTSVRRALILTLGTYGPERLPPGAREPLIAKLLDLYENDPDSGIHGAVEWTLRQWTELEKLRAIDARLRGKEKGERRWYVNSLGQTCVLVEGPVEFEMGSPPNEPDRDPDETQHRRSIPRRFAIAAKEVSVEQYQEFLERNPKIGRIEISRNSPEPTGPMNRMTWYQATAFCNWLSRQEGLPECYEPNSSSEHAEGMRIRADALKCEGYRLPTEAEWEYSCRAGAMTSRCYGRSTELLPKYAWYQANSKDRAWPGGSLLPNDLGMFDMLGNVYEWCQDRYASYEPGKMALIIDEIDTVIVVENVAQRLTRGLAFNCFPTGVRSASRNKDAPFLGSLIVGFRPARTYH